MASKASSTTGVTIDITTGTGTAVTGLSFTAAKPAHLTGTALTIAAGDVIEITNSGVKALDGAWVVGTATATDIVLLASDTTGATPGALPAGATVTHYTPADFTGLCLAAFDVSVEQPSTLSVATFCDPSATLPVSASTAGTVSLSGFVDTKDPGYLTIRTLNGDGKTHMLRISLPNNGYLLMDGTLSGLGWQVALNDAQRWTATFTLSMLPHHVF